MKPRNRSIRCVCVCVLIIIVYTNDPTLHTRAAPVVEVVDISDREAEKYLARMMPKDLAKQVVALIGGMFVHMISAIEIHKVAGKEKENKTDVTNVMCLIKEYLVAKYIRHGLMEMDVKKNYVVLS